LMRIKKSLTFCWGQRRKGGETGQFENVQKKWRQRRGNPWYKAWRRILERDKTKELEKRIELCLNGGKHAYTGGGI